MATIVKGDLYYKLDGKLDEIKRQMRQKEGYGFNPERLDLALQAIVEGRFEAVGGQFPSVILAAEFIHKGWTVVQDVQPSTFKMSNLEFVPLVGSVEDHVYDLKTKLGLVDMKYVLDHSEEIPSEFRDKYLVFAGTLLRNSDGLLYIACLRYGDITYYRSPTLLRLNSGWGGDGFRLVRNKNK